MNDPQHQVDNQNKIIVQKEIEHRHQLEKIARIGSIEWLLETNEFWWSEQFQEILNLSGTPVEPSVQNLISFIHPDEQKRVQDALESITHKGGSFRLYTQGLSAKGVQIPFLFYAEYNAKEQKIIGYIQDISENYTERKSLEDTLAKYRGVMSGAGDAIILMSLSQGIIEGNEKAAKLLEIDKDKISQLDIEDIHHNHDYDNLMAHYQGVLWGQDHLLESTIISQNGRETPVEISGRSINIGSEQYLIVILRDLTRQQKSQNALRQSEKRYRSLVDGAREGIMLLNATGEIISVNPKICEETNMGKLELLNLNFKSITLFDTHSNPIDTLNSSMTKTSLHVEGYLKSRNMESAPTAFNISKYEDNDGIKYIVTAYNLSVVRDAEAQRSELQKKLFQSQKLETLGQLAGSFAHDFNNLLSPILLVSDVLMDHSKEDDFIFRNLNIVNQAATKARRLIARILDYARPEDYRPVKIDLSHELDDMLELFTSSISDTITIQKNIPNQNFECFADPDQIHRMLMNIAMNAAHSIDNNSGEITFTLDHTYITDPSKISTNFDIAKGHYARLCISDTGVGIPDKILPNIFDPFFTSKPQTDGSGLGLSVVMQAIQNHSGAISVKKNDPKGTVMTLYLPLIERLDQGDI